MIAVIGRIFVVGLGLIGGSLALCVKAKHQGATIIGYDLNNQNVKLGKMLGVIDESVLSIEEGAKDADLIVLSTPVQVTEQLIKELAALPLKPNVIITDVGSTKAQIVKSAEVLSTKGITFIGGHPMAGSHKSGVSAAKEILFENAFYLLTPGENTNENDVHTLMNWLSGTKAKFLVVSPEEHDLLTGVISHMPHIIAASLVHQADDYSKANEWIPRLCAGGFRDTTRIASSSPAMWRDILLQNKNILLQLMQNWQEEMKKVVEMIQLEESEKIFNYFLEAKTFRDQLPQNQKGAIPSFYDLFVDVPDYPGVISEITGYLAKEEISITNIRIIETREEIYGILVISFQTEEDRLRAAKCITEYSNYETSIGS